MSVPGAFLDELRDVWQGEPDALRRDLAAGRLVLATFFGGDLALWDDRKAQERFVRLRPAAPIVDWATLRLSARIFAQVASLPPSALRLTREHHLVLLPVGCPAQKRRWVRRALLNAWSAYDLRRRIDVAGGGHARVEVAPGGRGAVPRGLRAGAGTA